MESWRKIPAFLWPGKENFQKIKDEPIKTSLIYLFSGVVFFAAANLIFNLEYFSEYPVEHLAFMMLITAVALVGMLFLACSISFLAARVLGGKNTYYDMLKIVTYSFTPAYFFGWLYPVGFLAVALSFGNIFAGVASIFRLNIWKSIVVAAAPLLAFFLFFLVFVYVIFNTGTAAV